MLQHKVDVRALRFVVEVGHFVVQTCHQAFGAGSVVTGDIKNEGVVEFPHSSIAWITRPVSWSVMSR